MYIIFRASFYTMSQTLIACRAMQLSGNITVCIVLLQAAQDQRSNSPTGNNQGLLGSAPHMPNKPSNGKDEVKIKLILSSHKTTTHLEMAPQGGILVMFLVHVIWFRNINDEKMGLKERHFFFTFWATIHKFWLMRVKNSRKERKETLLRSSTLIILLMQGWLYSQPCVNQNKLNICLSQRSVQIL